MNDNTILRIAINAPLSRLFDYLPPQGADAAALRPGCRLRVPFGHRQAVGMLLELTDKSSLPHARLKRASALLDESPLLAERDLWLLRFAADYYHHPIGEVVAAALPALLRRGRQLSESREVIALTEEGRTANLVPLQRRAPRQFEFMEILLASDNQALDTATLEDRLPGWRRQKLALLERGWIRSDFVSQEEDAESLTAPEAGPELNENQQAAVDRILATPGFMVSLLDGVTGSGKTEVYLRLMQSVLHAGRQVLILVPEIGLTPQFVARLQKRLGREPALLHSGLSDSARLAAWRAARSGAASLLIGTRSAVFTPLADPGLIIIDEEHDSSFKQQEGLRYSARDLGIVRAKQMDIPVVLGSATPSLESLHNCEEGNFQRLELPHRAGAANPPSMRLVDTSTPGSADGLSPALAEAMQAHLEAGNQVLLFLNRRGFAPTLICVACGHIVECPRCDARMTVHARSAQLLCHHCGASRPLTQHCSECGADCRPLGHGTERLESVLHDRFPGQSIARIDSDSVQRKGTMDQALQLATSGDASILVGTQMLSKGHHFPQLTLVGVINADQGLFGTDFRAAEKMAQGLIQVAGRAGREQRAGEVLIQTSFPQHAFWKELLGGGYRRVATAALQERRLSGWPPYSRLALIRSSSHRREDARRFLERARDLAAGMRIAEVRVLGPVGAAMERRAGRYRAELLLQSESRAALHTLLRKLRPLLEEDRSVKRVRWSIDVDPIEFV